MPYDASCYPAGSPSGLQSPAEGNPPAALSHRPPLRLQHRKPQRTVQRHLRDCRPSRKSAVAPQVGEP
jgi:hypothetical protein